MFYIVRTLIFFQIVGFNVVLWFFPLHFINYMKTAEKSRIAPTALKTMVLKILDTPSYIWLPRIIFGIALIVFINMFYL
jgi:hypothetical protein